MSTRRRVRIEVELPDLTPTQAEFLWNLLDDLASELWDAYETDIIELENTFSREVHAGDADDEYEAHLENGSAFPHLVDDSEPDPDF